MCEDTYVNTMTAQPWTVTKAQVQMPESLEEASYATASSMARGGTGMIHRGDHGLLSFPRGGPSGGGGGGGGDGMQDNGARRTMDFGSMPSPRACSRGAA